MTGFEPVHTPAWQAFVCMHRFVPAHVVPSDSFDHVVVDVAGVQTWQALAGFTVPAG